MSTRVLDKNMFTADATNQWLSKNDKNFAVLTDFSIMETYSGNAIVNFTDSFKVLCKYPKQIIQLKDNNNLRIITRSAGFKIADLIDWGATIDLRKSLIAMDNSEFNTKNIKEILLKNGKIADDKLKEILNSVGKNKDDIEDMGRIIRNAVTGRDGNGLPIFGKKGIEKIRTLIMDVTIASFNRGIDWVSYSGQFDLHKTFEFRYAAATVAMLIVRLTKGSFKTLSNVTARNDVVDCNYLACSTYWDDFSTNDENARMSYKFMQEVVLH